MILLSTTNNRTDNKCMNCFNLSASGYIVRLSEEQRNLQESHFDSAPEETLLETTESLLAAGVYQTAGTQVEAEVPVGRQLERGHLYYVALKALDNDGLSR